MPYKTVVEGSGQSRGAVKVPQTSAQPALYSSPSRPFCIGIIISGVGKNFELVTDVSVLLKLL